MERTFWNDAAVGGLFVGLLLGLSAVLETTLIASGSWTGMLVWLVEWIAAFVAHIALLLWVVRRRAQLYSVEEGFSFSQGYGFVVAVSALGGVICAVLQYVHVHSILGFDNYVAGISELFSRFGGRNAETDRAISGAIRSFKELREPTLLSTLFSGVFSSVFFGAIFGLFIAGATSREPQYFADNDPDHE